MNNYKRKLLHREQLYEDNCKKTTIQRIPESSCERKEIVDIDILVTSMNGDKKNMQSIRIMCIYNVLKNKEVEPAEPVQMNIYQSNTYRKDLSWLHFDNYPRVQ